MKSYFNAKKMIFTKHLSDDGIAILNIDDPYGRQLAEILRKCGISVSTFGGAQCADVNICDVELSLSGLKLTLRLENSMEVTLSSKLCGDFNAKNIAGAATAALALGAPINAVAEGVANMKNVPGRMERCGERNIFVDYAHTDDALANVLSMMRKLVDSEGSNGKLIVLFGCGGDRDKAKRSRMGSVAAKFADEIFITTDNPRTESPSAIIADILKGIPASTIFTVIEQRAEAIASAVSATNPNDLLVIAGKGHETYQEINGTRIHFDDREIVKNSLLF
jgi:UDP-N-acetylmuramoyl-L-alanyl-D-glutamate--2,6-diaminopimelate ligase